MLARGELGHDAAVRGVDLVLGQDDVAQDLVPVRQDGGRRLVAGRFDAQDVHGSPSISEKRNGREMRPEAVRDSGLNQ